jgi:hypothetical protein
MAVDDFTIIPPIIVKNSPKPRRLVERHPLSRWRNERQRSASSWATSAATFSTSGHDPS